MRSWKCLERILGTWSIPEPLATWAQIDPMSCINWFCVVWNKSETGKVLPPDCPSTPSRLSLAGIERQGNGRNRLSRLPVFFQTTRALCPSLRQVMIRSNELHSSPDPKISVDSAHLTQRNRHELPNIALPRPLHSCCG